MKYENLQSDIFSIFASSEWQNEAIRTIPQNSIIQDSNEFIRVSILPSLPGINGSSVSGVIMAEIFTPAGNGPARTNTIADKLDKHLSQRAICVGTGKITQMFSSSLVFNGVDGSNPSLVKSTFSVPFSYFGV